MDTAVFVHSLLRGGFCMVGLADIEVPCDACRDDVDVILNSVFLSAASEPDCVL